MGREGDSVTAQGFFQKPTKDFPAGGVSLCVMKPLLLAATLLLAAFPTTGFSQDTPPKLIPEFKAKDSTLSEVVAKATEILGNDAPNVIYYDDAQKLIVPEIHVKNVSMEGLLNAIGQILPAGITTTPNPGGQPTFLVLPYRKAPPTAPTPPAPPSDTRGTYMLFIPHALKPDAIIELIRTAWTLADPNWEKSEFPPKILFHVETRTLLMHASSTQGATGMGVTNLAVSNADQLQK
jgi:hypothetical protein